MPQLDIYGFMPVVSWLIVVIFLFYILLLATGLPKIYKILLYRKKNLEYYYNLRNFFEKEVYLINKVVYKFISTFIKQYKFGTQISMGITEKTLEIEKDLLVKESFAIKNWGEMRYIFVPKK